MPTTHNIKLALVCSMGGHFEQMTNLSEFYMCYDHFWITNRNKQTESELRKERAYYINEGLFKRPWTYLSQLAPLFRVFFKERPTHVLSTGSGTTAFIPFLLSKFFSIKFFHIDTFSRVNGQSKFGAFLLKTNNKIYKQWDDQRNKNTIYIGPIFRHQEEHNNGNDRNHVFVTLGTREEPFIRLIRGVEELVEKGVIKEKVIIQAGHTKYHSIHVDMVDFVSPEKINELISTAKYVITQESAGIGTQCLKHRTKFIVMPRDYQYGELLAKSDMKEDLQYKLEEMGYTRVVNTTSELEEAIKNIDSLKIGFTFDNSMAIETLHEAVND